MLPGKITDTSCFGVTVSTTLTPKTAPKIPSCDVSLVAGLWSNLPESKER